MTITPSSQTIRDGVEVRTLEIGLFTVFENTLGFWSGYSETRSDVFSRYLHGELTIDDYFDDMHRRFGCLDMTELVSGLDTDATLKALPALAGLGGLELAEALRKRVCRSQVAEQLRLPPLTARLAGVLGALWTRVAR